MLRRLITAAFALACATLVAACNPAQLGTAALPASPTLQPGALSQPALADAGVPQATAEKIATKVAQVQAVAARVCAFVPTAETIANLFLAESNARSTVQGLANVACKAVARSGAYASLPTGGGGREVSGVAIVNGHEVAIRGRLLR